MLGGYVAVLDRRIRRATVFGSPYLTMADLGALVRALDALAHIDPSCRSPA
jgi:hypothetical protein